MSSESDTAGLSARLSRYLDVVVGLRAQRHISRSEFLDRCDFVSGATLRADLDVLQIDSTRLLQPVTLEAAIRRQLDDIEGRSEGGLALDRAPKVPTIEPGQWGSPPPSSAAAAAAAAETAFDLSITLDSYVDGHGAMLEGAVAYPHQLATARRILSHVGSVIVADEVGLGKTITAGLVIADVLSRNPGATVLILVPSNLVSQWASELGHFFSFHAAESANAASSTRPPMVGSAPRPRDVASQPQVLLSVDRAKREDLRRILLQRRWDWLILDEAHDVRNAESQRARFIFSLNADRRLYLTATPVHNTAYDIYHLVNSLRPGFFASPATFAESFLDANGSIRSSEELQRALSAVMYRTRRAQTTLAFPRREIAPVRLKRRQPLEAQLYRDVLRLLRSIYKRNVGAAVPVRRKNRRAAAVEQTVIVAMLVLKELSSHPRAALSTLGGALRTRVQALAKVTGDTTDLEALDATLAPYEGETRPHGTHKKTDTFLEMLPGLLRKHRKVIVYVHFTNTLIALREHVAQLIDQGGLRRCELLHYDGKLAREEKEQAVARLNDANHACLISTDAGGTGLNLQAAGAVVNFDFPWNPMVIEQRIGRIDRLGQQRSTVGIYNFVTEGTIEKYVYAVLQEKLSVCDDVLGDIESPLVFEMLRRPADFGIGTLILSSEDDEDMARRFDALVEDIDKEVRVRGWDIRRPDPLA